MLGLAALASKSRRARRKVVIWGAVTLVVGLAFIEVAADRYKVLKLRGEGRRAKRDIRSAGLKAFDNGSIEDSIETEIEQPSLA